MLHVGDITKLNGHKLPIPEAVTKKHFGDGEGLEGDYEQYL